jgi:type VI secretion system (T6SS) effector Tae4 (amidase)
LIQVRPKGAKEREMGLINIYYKTMFEMHPWPTNFKTMIDGAILKFHQDPKTSNTCASEISYALNCIDGHAVDTSGDYGKGSFLVKKVRTLPDKDGYEYIFSTLDLRQYLNNRYGSGQQFPNTSKIGKRNGVIIFEPAPPTIGHTDVWVDGEIDNPSLYISDWYAKVKNQLCFFWDLNT